MQLDLGAPEGNRQPAGHLALLWADPRGVLSRFDLVRPSGYVGRRVQIDVHVNLYQRLTLPAA